MPQPLDKSPPQGQASFLQDGIVRSDYVYHEEQLMEVLGINYSQLMDYYRNGLQFTQTTWRTRRRIAGLQYIRFVEDRSKTWDDYQKGYGDGS